MKLKPGADLDGIRPQTLRAMATADEIAERFGQELIVTSALDGKHMKNSLHYKGLAFDMRTRFWRLSGQRKVVAALAEALGEAYDVVLEKTHIHVEYDPK